MNETADDLRWLQSVLDESRAAAGPFLRKSFEMPAKSLDADELRDLLGALSTVAVGTSSRSGDPRVAPSGALFYRGRFFIPTVSQAAKTRMVERNPGISLTYYEGNDRAVIVHGQAQVITNDHDDFAALEAQQLEASGNSVRDWGDGVFLRVNPSRIFTFDRDKGSS